MATLEWKRIVETYDGAATPSCSTYRAKVFGGWLVAVWSAPGNSTDSNKHTYGGGVTFVPDPYDAWKVDEKPLVPPVHPASLEPDDHQGEARVAFCSKPRPRRPRRLQGSSPRAGRWRHPPSIFPLFRAFQAALSRWLHDGVPGPLESVLSRPPAHLHRGPHPGAGNRQD